MKSSFYNFFLRQQSHIICFNALSFKYFSFSHEQEKIVDNIINNPDEYINRIPVFYNKLKDGNFIVNDDIIESDSIVKQYNAQSNSKHYKLIIMPTLECNFRCWYCVQNHVKGKIEKDMLHRIYKHIEYMITKEQIKSLSLSWFGGEPFMYFSEIIKPISIFAKTICEKHNIPFYSSATTNGFLVIPEIVNQLQDYNFKEFQITLDGDREHHNQTRVSKKTSSFDAILNNVNYICVILDCIVNLRVNYDEKNLNPEKIMAQVDEIISPECRSKIRFIFRRVWQVNSVSEEQKKLIVASSILQKKGYTANIDLIQNFIPCYASRKYCNTISFNGDVYKCTAKEMLHKDALGYLDKNGIIQWHNKDFETIYYKPLFDKKKCLQCKYLPVCMGPCTRRLEDNGLKAPDFYCRKKISGLEFEDSMLNYCKKIQ
jgi:uncharacterized protein